MFLSELRFAVLKLFKRLFYCSSYCYFDITEIDDVNTNELYNAVQLYPSSSASITSSRLSLTRALNSSSTTFDLSNNYSLVDTFNGVSVLWEHVVTQRQSQSFLRQQLHRLGAATPSLSTMSLMVEASSEGDAQVERWVVMEFGALGLPMVTGMVLSWSPGPRLLMKGLIAPQTNHSHGHVHFRTTHLAASILNKFF